MSKKNILFRGKNKLLRIYHQPNTFGSEMAFLQRVLKENTNILDKVASKTGENWENTNKPVAVIWGVEKWKQEAVSSILRRYRTAFVNGPQNFQAVRKCLGDDWKEDKVFIFAKGARAPLATFYAKRKRLSIFTLGDGFLMSYGFGAAQYRPLSITLEEKTTQRNSGSELETQIKSTMAADKPVADAKAGVAIMNAAKLTRDYSLKTRPSDFDLETFGNESVLIVGVPEANKNNNYSNSNLVTLAAKKFPDAELFYYRYMGINSVEQKGFTLSDLANSKCELLPVDYPFYKACSQVDHVIANGIGGFEALLMGKKVTSTGHPFYAGWGVSDDLYTPLKEKKSLEQVFAASYLRYPKYLHPASDVTASYFDIASYLIVERLKGEDIFNIEPALLDIEVLKEHQNYLSAPANLFLYLNQTQFMGEAKTDEVMEIAQRDFQLADVQQFSNLLIQTSNYDALKVYCDFAVHEFNRQWQDIKQNKTLINNFFSNLGTVQKNSNGRIIESVNDISDDVVELINADPLYHGFAVNYVRTSSNNLKYEQIEKFLTSLKKSEFSNDQFLSKICAILKVRPTRSERDHATRHRLLLMAASHYKKLLSRKYNSQEDLLLNMALYNMQIDQDLQVIGAYDKLVGLFKKDEFSFDNPKFNKWGSLRKRLGHFTSIYHYLLKKGHYSYVENMLKTQFFIDKNLHGKYQRGVMEDLWLSFHAARADYDRYGRKYRKCSEFTRNKPKTIIGYAKSLRAIGEFDAAHKILSEFLPKANTYDKWVAVKTEIEKIEFANRTAQLLASYPQPRVPKGVIFLASQTCYNTIAMMVPSLIALKKQGYAVINLMQGMLPDEPTGIAYLDKFASSIPMTFYYHKLRHSWSVNWKNRIVEANDINFYQGFYERLSTAHRVYHVDINQDAIYRDFMVQLKRSDTCLDVCERIYDSVVKRNINVAFVTGNSHVTPFSAFRDFARAKDDPRLSFINCNVAYESYFSNLGSKFAQTMCVTDMTLHKNRRAPFMAVREQFEAWYEKNKDNQDYKTVADDMIKVNRNSSTSNETELKLVEELTRERAAGKKVICCFGKVPVDLNVPYDGGAAHTDMADWISHTARVVGEADDLILLIKPHPHELRPEIALDLIDSFSDLIDVEIKPNVKVLGHRDINVHALAPHLDLAVLWNGSSSLELTALGIPVMLCAWFGQHDYPVDMIYPESREQYDAYLKAGQYRIPSEELRNKAAFLISYMGTDEITTFNDYALRQLTNDKVGVPKWREDRIKTLFEEGDPNMDKIASQIIEKFTLAEAQREKENSQ